MTKRTKMPNSGRHPVNLAITTTETTHLPGHHTPAERTRCGVSMGEGWYVVEGDAPTCEKCRALATHDSGGQVPWWEEQ